MAHALENLFASILDSPLLARQQPALPGCATLAAKEGGEKTATSSTPPTQPQSNSDRIIIGHEITRGFSILAVQEPDGTDGMPGQVSFAPFLSERLKREQRGHFEWDRSFPVER